MKEAMFYKKLKDDAVQCELCPNFCVLNDGATGKCRARQNFKGNLISLSYGHLTAVHVDPIEKKPLHHFMPKTWTYSIGSAGCTLGCEFCQNWEISQASIKMFSGDYAEPEEIVIKAIESGCPSISYTYNEPTTFYEYMIDIAKIAKQKGLKNIMVTNGYINPKPLKELCKYIDAANVDLKGFSEEFYKKVCYGQLKPVLECLKIMKQEKVWIEITNLVIPGYNDRLDDIEKMCVWIKKNLGRKTPLHFSRFFPMYKFDKEDATKIETLKKAEKIAKKYLDNVHIGNV